MTGRIVKITRGEGTGTIRTKGDRRVFFLSQERHGRRVRDDGGRWSREVRVDRGPDQRCACGEGAQDMTDEPFDAPNRKSVAAVMGLWLFVFVVLMVDVHVVRSLRSERFLHARVTRTPFHLF